MVDVFISYRRKDSLETCRELYRHLTEDLPDLEIFMDVEDIDSGKKWREVLEKGVKNCDVLLAVIGPEWLSIENDEGVRRITETTDYVRREISKAIRNHKGIIPVMLPGVPIPKENELPASIKALPRYQDFKLSDNLEADAKKLALKIRSAIKEKKAADRGRLAYKIFERVGIALIFPFYILSEIASRLVKGRSSTARNLMRFIVMALICIGSFWLLYLLVQSILHP